MGQKVSPHGLRVGIIKDWSSKWFTKKTDFKNWLVNNRTHKGAAELSLPVSDGGIFYETLVRSL